jgi:hypothetical protein
MSSAGPVSPNVVRALVRQALEERFSVIAPGPECSEDMDFPIRKPCLIEPHRPCYNSGYCRKLGH